MHKHIKDQRWGIAGKLIEQLAYMYGDANVLLAGGAVRDVLNDKEVKDFDFFIHAKPPTTQPFRIGLKGSKLLTFTKSAKEEYANDDFETWTSDGGHYQLMFITYTPSKAIGDFDINICKCWYSPVTGFGYARAYLEGMQDKVIKSYGYSEHLTRVQEKYPEFDVKVEIPIGLARLRRMKV